MQERVPKSFWLGGRLSTVQSEGEREVTNGKNDIFKPTEYFCAAGAPPAVSGD